MSNGKNPNTNFGMSDGVDLKEYFECRLKDMEKATDLAYQNLQFRLASMNEFREQMKDQASTFITRAEHNVLMQKLDTAVEDLKKSRDEQTGKASVSSVYIAYIISFVGILIAIIGLILKLKG